MRSNRALNGQPAYFFMLFQIKQYKFWLLMSFKRVRRFVNRETAVKAHRGLIEPYLNYCCPVWDGIGSELSSELQKLQNRAARMITERTYV